MVEWCGVLTATGEEEEEEEEDSELAAVAL